MKRFIYALSCLWLFSCQQEFEVEATVAGKEPIPIGFSTEYDVNTRATDTQFENNDEIGVFVAKWNGSQEPVLRPTGNYADNKLFKFAGTGFTSAPVLYFPDDKTPVDVYAYYPKVESARMDSIGFAAKLDQSVGNNYAMSDFMYATVYNTAPSSEKIPLKFWHLFTKVIINLDATSIPAGTPTVTVCYVYTTIKLDFITYEYTKTKVNDIKACSNGTRSYKVLLPAQTIYAGDEFIKVTINGTNYTWKPDSDIVLEQGVENSYTITF